MRRSILSGRLSSDTSRISRANSAACPKRRVLIRSSTSQNRILQDSYTLDAKSGAVLRHEAFSQRPLIDRAVSMGTAYHEGQLFGVLNQVLGLFTALGAMTLSISSVVMWWRRRPAGVLGAPVATQRPALAPILIASFVFIPIAFPIRGISIIALKFWNV